MTIFSWLNRSPRNLSSPQSNNLIKKTNYHYYFLFPLFVGSQQWRGRRRARITYFSCIRLIFSLSFFFRLGFKAGLYSPFIWNCACCTLIFLPRTSYSSSMLTAKWTDSTWNERSKMVESSKIFEIKFQWKSDDVPGNLLRAERPMCAVEQHFSVSDQITFGRNENIGERKELNERRRSIQRYYLLLVHSAF